MNGNLRHVWIYTATDLWEPLTAFSNAPPDLFSDLYEAVDDYLAVSTLEPQFEAIRNDPVIARESFLALNGTDFASESDIVNFLDEARDDIADYDIAGYEELYKRLLRALFRKYNLRYRLDEPFKIRFLLPGSFTNLYAELHRSMWLILISRACSPISKHAFDCYAHSQDPTDLRTCIARASNYARRSSFSNSRQSHNRKYTWRSGWAIDRLATRQSPRGVGQRLSLLLRLSWDPSWRHAQRVRSAFWLHATPPSPAFFCSASPATFLLW